MWFEVRYSVWDPREAKVIAPDESHKSACTKSSSYRMRCSTCSTGFTYRCHTTEGRSGGVAGLSRRPQRGAGGLLAVYSTVSWLFSEVALKCL
jgi:hypothetical protein